LRKVPDKLTFGERDGDIPWETEMELEIGDMVWFNLIESKNAVELSVDKKILRIIPYQDVYCAKREYWVDKWTGKKDTKVIMLNGFVLLEQVSLPKLSKLDYFSEDKIYTDRGIVRYLGKPNKRYVRPDYVDNIDIKEGDLVFIQAGYTPFPLERRTYFSLFNKNKLYYVIQRRRLIFSI
jgi:hypothetical protein